jgi:hypothetical protein
MVKHKSARVRGHCDQRRARSRGSRRIALSDKRCRCGSHVILPSRAGLVLVVVKITHRLRIEQDMSTTRRRVLLTGRGEARRSTTGKVASLQSWAFESWSRFAQDCHLLQKPRIKDGLSNSVTQTANLKIIDYGRLRLQVDLD